MTALQQKLSLYGLTMIAVGSCIGSGIFVTPAQIAREVPLLYTGISAAFVINTLIFKPVHAPAGLGPAILGVAVFGAIKKVNRNNPVSQAKQM